jgi:Fic family protein
MSYQLPNNWIKYDFQAIANDLAFAKGSIIAMSNYPYQRSWADALQELQLKREIGGTTRIEGAVFEGDELQAALSQSATGFLTRSQRQAIAAKNAYRVIAAIPSDQPITEELVCRIHRLIVSDADDDHCVPGQYRTHNVSFGVPPRQGAMYGKECEQAMQSLLSSVNTDFKNHDPLIRALALHYHLGAIHPFSDGNGRTARALEALMLGRAGLKDLLFIALSNFYHDERGSYLDVLNTTGKSGHDLTEFIRFGLRGIRIQCERLLNDLKKQLSKSLFRDVMHQLYRRLSNKRRRVIVERQIEILNVMLENESLEYNELYRYVRHHYDDLDDKPSAFVRDMTGLLDLSAIRYERTEKKEVYFILNLEWPTQFTETELYHKFMSLPISKTHKFN